MSNPLNPDQTQTGYADGLRHGEAGQPKDQGGVVKHPKTWVFGNPSMDSYFEGYNQGHADGLAKVNRSRNRATEYEDTRGD
jgi:hypothetical protein